VKFGMPTLVECKDLCTCCTIAEENGLDFVEINMSFPQYRPDALKVGEVVDAGKSKRLFFTIHADEQLNPFDFNPKVSQCYFDVMCDTIRFAKEIGAPIINMHLLRGVYVTLPEKIILLNDVYQEKYLMRVKEFVGVCEREIGNSDIKIAIENTSSFTKSQLEAIDIFMNSKVFCLTLDTGHEHCAEYADSRIFLKYPDRLRHLHLHDARGKSDHLPFGEGDVKIKEKLSLLPNSATCLVEVKTVYGLKKSVEYLKNHGLK